MTRTAAFCSRNIKELIRDPLTLIFGMGLPCVLLLFMTMLWRNIPGVNPAFAINNFAPGMAVFSFSFVSLFCALLISGDKRSSFLARLFASPMRSADFIAGYALPMLPIALIQGCVCFALSLLLGLELSVNILVCLLVLVPVAVMYVGFGVLFGSLFSDRQTGGIFTIFVNLTTWLSGTWFDLTLVGGPFEKIGRILPFSHAVDAAKYALAGELYLVGRPLLTVTVYAVGIFLIAVFAFKKKMKV